MNRFVFMGRLARDPELRYIPNGTAVCEVGIALNHVYKTALGEKREETTFVEVVFWRGAAEAVCKYFRKGKMMAGEGRLKMETWEAQDGSKRSKLKVQADKFHFCGDGARPNQEEAPASTTAAPLAPAAAVPGPPPPPDEDIPF